MSDTPSSFYDLMSFALTATDLTSFLVLSVVCMVVLYLVDWSRRDFNTHLAVWRDTAITAATQSCLSGARHTSFRHSLSVGDKPQQDLLTSHRRASRPAVFFFLHITFI